MMDGINMGETSAEDSGDRRRPVLTETVVHVCIPKNRLFMCGSEPPNAAAMIEALELFIRETATVIFKLEIEKTI